MKRSQLYYWILLSILFVASNPVGSQELKYEFLFEAEALLDTPIIVGTSPVGTRIIYPVKGGTIQGPDLRGKILPGGADWMLKLDSVTYKLDIRAAMETDEGEIIYTYYSGYIYMNPDKTYYFRTNPMFETGSVKYGWLNHTIAVGVGRLTQGGVAYRVYVIR